MENTEFGKTLETTVNDRIQEARNRTAQRKKVLAGLTFPSDSMHAHDSVQRRLDVIKNKPVEQEGSSKKKDKTKPGNAADLVKGANQLSKKMEKAGLAAPTPAQKENDRKSKEQEKAREQKREEAKKQQEEKMKKYDNISLPGGLTIKEEAGQWRLYNKDGKSVDVTSTMETIRQQNGRINEANKQIDKQNKLVENPKVPTVDKAISDDGKVDVVSTVLSNDNIKKEVFGDLAKEVSPEAIQEISKISIDHAEDTRLLDMLKDPSQAEEALKELEDKDKRNKNRAPKEMPTPVQSNNKRGGMEL